jgi:hypothetical protein
MEFKSWPKMTRVENRRTPIFTEKIDGTNACVVIGRTDIIDDNAIAEWLRGDGDRLVMWAQSRTRFIRPDDDNYGFARWVQENAEALFNLGEGYHFGEWWGQGIQRGYGQTKKRFSLFDTRRWNADNPPPPPCEVVPVLPVTTIEEARDYLLGNGSAVAPGFINPEGAVMFDLDTKTPFKIIINK